MKKQLLFLALCSVLTSVSYAETDNRSEWAKSQDMYVEPTLRVSETTVPVTQAQQASNPNLQVFALQPGQAVNQTQTMVYGPDGKLIKSQKTSSSQQPANSSFPAPQSSSASQPKVKDLSRPYQKQYEQTPPIQDLSVPYGQ